jgi:preprotein translocase subunit SecY
MMYCSRKAGRVKKRIFFTVFMLGVYRVATQVPTPGVDSAALASYFEGMQGSIFGVFNNFSGGALERFSVLLLELCHILHHQLSSVYYLFHFLHLAEIQKDSEGHKKFNSGQDMQLFFFVYSRLYGLGLVLKFKKSKWATNCS